MKIFFLILFGSSLAFASLPASTMKDIETFSKRTLNEKKDLSDVKKIVEILLKLDDEDPSRTAVMILSESYNKYPKIYDRAIKSVETPQNKKQLKEIHTILKDFNKKGNG